MSTYNPSTPNSTDLISATQAPIKTNFTQLNNQFNIDHIDFVTGSNLSVGGRHKQVTIDTPLGSDPGPGSTTGVFYTKSVTGVTQAFFQNATVVSQLTGLAQSIGTNGYTTLPGGLILQWGVASVGSGVTTITYPNVFPNSIFSVVLGPVKTSPIASTVLVINGQSNVNTTNFQVIGSASDSPNATYWVAIGN